MPIERRKYPRYILDFPLNIYTRFKKLKGKGVGKNISLGGAFFITNVELKEGMRVDLSFIPPPEVSEHYFDLKVKVPGTIKRIESKEDENKGVAVEFHLNLKDFIIEKLYKPIRRNSSILGILILLNILFLKSLNFKFFWHSIPVNLYSIIVATYILTRFLFALFYLPVKDNDYLPSVSVIMPVKNEEEIIKDTIEYAYNVNYPKDKYEIIIINDNSTDSTLSEVYQLQKKYSDLIVLNFTEDAGKRNAMAAGFYQAKGEIVVVLDSDSFLSKDSIYNIVQDFVDSEVAAASGHTDVYNAKENALTKMQAVRYFLSFKIMKAAESLFSSVTCCPGCFSAYRKSCVMNVIDKWRNQKFLGKQCTFGDDRSLTMMLLRKYKIYYNSSAIAFTVVPKTYKHFFNQQLRWKKSWFREYLLGCKFMWKKNIFMSFSFYAGFILPIISPIVAFLAIVYRPLVFDQPFYMYIYGTFLVSLIYSLYYRSTRPSKIWVYGILFCFFYLCILTWQNYFAMLTIKTTKWGTRDKFFKH